MPVDKKHEAALAARRDRDQKARDMLVDSYVKKLILREFQGSAFDTDFPKEFSVLIEARRMALYAHRVVAGKSGPAMDAIRESFKRKYQVASNSSTKK